VTQFVARQKLKEVSPSHSEDLETAFLALGGKLDEGSTITSKKLIEVIEGEFKMNWKVIQIILTS